MPTTPTHFGIVGGGLLGLSLALRLAERGHRVTVLEGADHLGGLADAWQLGDITWDRHYHVILGSDEYLLRLLADLGVDNQLRWSQTKTGFLVDGQLYSMSSAGEFLRFPPLRLIDKLRLGWTIWHASRIRDWRRLEQIPVGDWLVRHSGRRTFEQIWRPLLQAKLGDAWQRTSAAFIWATIQRMYAARNGSQKREQFGYVSGGYRTILDALSKRLQQLDVRTVCSFKALSVERNEYGELVVTADDGSIETFDRVIATTAAPIAARLCPQLSADSRAGLAQTEYVGIVCASLLLRRPLAGYYVTNITSPAPFTGIIEMSALVEPAELAGHGLIYLPKYATAEDPIWLTTDAEVQERFIASLAEHYPEFDADDVLAFRVSRVRHVFALSTLNYSRTVPPIKTNVAGLYLVNSSQIVNGTLNVNETIRLAEESLDEVCQPMATPTNKELTEDECPDGELVARPR